MQKKYLLFVSALLFLLVLLVLFSFPDSNIHVITCNVGQGDGTLIVYGKKQIIIDGGPPNGKMKACLGRHMPFWDRKIELIVISHPQLDHFGGLIEIIDSYEVNKVLTSSLDNSTPEYRALEDSVGGSGIDVLDVSNVSSIGYGLLYLDIVHPTLEYIEGNSTSKTAIRQSPKLGILGTRTTDKDLNDFSIVLIVSLNDFDAVFTGDIGPEISDIVSDELAIGNASQRMEYIKIPHHGSKNGLTEKLLQLVKPEIAVISAGEGNQFGHPHKEILQMLKHYGVKTFRTDQVGDIEVVSDGEKFWIN